MIVGYTTRGEAIKRGRYTGREIDVSNTAATVGTRLNKTTQLAEGMVLVRDFHDYNSGMPNALTAAGAANTSTSAQHGNGRDWTIYTAADTTVATVLYAPVCVVTNAAFPRLNPGTVTTTSAANYEQEFEYQDDGEVQALVKVTSNNLSSGALLWLNDADGTLGDTAIGTATGMDTPAELIDITKRAIAVLMEPHTVDATATLRWVRLLRH